jgi:hypothetical protein
LLCPFDPSPPRKDPPMTNRAFGDVLRTLEALDAEAGRGRLARVGDSLGIQVPPTRGFVTFDPSADEMELIALLWNQRKGLLATARAAERLAEAGNKFKAANDEVRRLVVSGGIGRASYQAAVDTQQTAMLTFWRALAAYQTATKGE